MAITNAQQYQQLVNKPANGKRPGYRGIGGYRGGPGGSKDKGKEAPASQGFDKDAAPGGQSPEVYGASGPYNPEQALADAVKIANERPKGILNQIPSGVNLARNLTNSLFKKQLEKNRIDFVKS